MKNAASGYPLFVTNKTTTILFEHYNYDSSIDTTNHPKFILPNQKEKSIVDKGVKFQFVQRGLYCNNPGHKC